MSEFCKSNRLRYNDEKLFNGDIEARLISDEFCVRLLALNDRTCLCESPTEWKVAGIMNQKINEIIFAQNMINSIVTLAKEAEVRSNRYKIWSEIHEDKQVERLKKRCEVLGEGVR